MKKNPTSARKRGDLYQELWGIKLCGDWLLNPDTVEWLQFELIPEETEQRDFYLDDIVVLKKGGKYDLYQVKHKQNADNSWTWKELTNPLPNKKYSLLKKWASSLFRKGDSSGLDFYDKIDGAIFVTNASASTEITKYLSSEQIDIEAIKKSEPLLYKSIEKEIGGAKKAKLFFQVFKFKFSQKSENDFEMDVRKFFNSTLCVTKAGFDSFLKWVRNRAQDERTIKLQYEEIRKECEFDNPQPLNEDFVIPDDFEFFDNQIHKSLIKDFKKSDGGVKIVYGEPGSGKSVYLSKLDRELNEAGIISIKHHYHISPEDTSPMDRLNAGRVIEAIKAQFKTHREEIEELANINSKELPLGKFIEKLALKSAKNNKAFVIIIDGLDHPLKYGAKQELETLLSEICLPQKGMWIVIGMQLLAKPYLPPIIVEKCPEKEWIKIKGLNKQSVLNVLQKNLISLKLPTEEPQLSGLLDKIYQVTQGNPLHFRYTLQQLKNLNGNTLITEYTCESLIPYSGNIEEYYDSHWRVISDVAKNILLTIASVNFLFTEKQLIECISQTVSNPPDVTNGFNLIAHLTSVNYRKELSVFHNSFEVYLKKRPEYEQQKIVLRKNIKEWLTRSNNEYLQWAELKLIEHDLGNDTPLLELDRNWLLDAICRSSNSSQITSQLKDASRIAFDQKNFAKTLSISYLHTYYINLNINSEEAKELIGDESFYHNSTLFTYINFNELPTSSLPKLASLADSKGESKSVEEITKELIKRLERQEYRQGSVPLATKSLLEVIAFDRAHSVKRVYDYILQFRDLDISASLFKIYSSKLLILNQLQKIEELLKYSLTTEEKLKVFIECARYGLENKSEDLTNLFKGESNLPSICQIYLFVKSKIEFKLQDLPSYEIFPTTIEEYDSEKRLYWRDFYRENVLNGILYVLNKKANDLDEWTSNAPEIWSINAMSSLFKASQLIGLTILKSSINYCDLFNQLKDIPELSWPEDRDSLTIQHAFSDSLSQIFNDLKLIKIFLGDKTVINNAEFTLILEKPFLVNKNALLEIALNSQVPVFEQDVYGKVRDDNIKYLEESINSFPDRASSYANLSKLVRLYESEVVALPYLRKAADNLLGHGYHKDMYLFDVIEAIGFCAKGGMLEDKVNNWIERIIPLIEYVGEYTDSDETNYLPFELAELLAQQNIGLLYKNLFWATEKENLFHAEKLFKILLDSFTYDNEVEISLGRTALDSKSFSLLKQQAQSNSGAKEALDNIQQYLGEINYPPEDQGNSYTPPVVDYSKVSPSEILEHLNSNFENKWQLVEYLRGWTHHWITKHDKREIYELNKKLLDKFGIQTLSGEQLDDLVPLAKEFDNTLSFDLLCNAQINDHGWQRYWTDKKKAERRWEIIKSQFPQRYLEFFQKSAEGGIPLSRGVEYFVLFGDLKTAEKLTEESLNFAEELMADLAFPPVEWRYDKREVYLVDLLLQRLLWPSTITQERAATAIADLLIKSREPKNVFIKLLLWIENQKMESAVAIGLLPIIKTLSLVDDSNDVSFIEIGTIVKSLKISSVVIEELIKEIAKLLNVSNPTLPHNCDLEVLPAQYKVSKFFSRHVSTFLAPIYMSRATKIERRTGKPFVMLWALTADRIITTSGTVLDSNQVYYYGRNEHDDFLLGFSSKVSQVYRSAYLRVLQAFYIQGDIPKDFYLEWAYATLPIELSHWKISPNRSPNWWPELNEGDSSNKGDSFASLSFKNSIESLTKVVGIESVIAAEGAIKQRSDWQLETPLHSFSLIGFGYKVVGSELPTPEEVATEVLYAPGITIPPSKTEVPLHFLEDRANFMLIGDEVTRLKDLIVYPLVVREHDLCIGLWQYFRDFEVSMNLTPELTEGLELKVDGISWFYEGTDGKKIGMYKDWLAGLRERYNRDLPLHHGHYILFDKPYLEEWLKERSLRLGYILKSTFRTRKYSYEKIQEYKEIKLLNVSSIII